MTITQELTLTAAELMLEHGIDLGRDDAIRRMRTLSSKQDAALLSASVSAGQTADRFRSQYDACRDELHAIQAAYPDVCRADVHGVKL